ncbi:hypothetical protein SY88_01160 [Clostridiales bacterium PH28_bin88]|nr:hypothetical protein SY88_01160 [Clostridiales bacterium PH28_bin88]
MKIRKRLFIGLLGVSLLVLVGLVLSGWFLAAHRQNPVYRVLLGMVGGAGVLLALAVAFGIAGLVLTLWWSRFFPPFQNLMIMATNLLFPVALAIGRLLKINQDVIKSSFIEVNNQLVRTRGVAVNPEQVMILAPHCLQKSDCKHKITLDASNCRRCGGCPVHDLHRIADTYGVHLVVATGGTLARKFVQQLCPRAIVAIACERDLTSGIQDTNPLPVLGVLNIRPEGPCFNTRVNLGSVEEAVRYFLRGEFRRVQQQQISPS